MKESKVNQEFKKKTAEKLTAFKEKMIKDFNMAPGDFYKETGIAEEAFRAYEAAEKLPCLEDMQKLALNCGVNLNWLVCDGGAMFGAREKEMEEIIGEIEGRRCGRYEHYKTLLQAMSSPFLEGFIFPVHGLLVDMLSQIEDKIKESPENIKLLEAMTHEIDYGRL